MGTGITITCRTCGQQDEYTVGIGMLYGSLENVIKQVHPSLRAQVLVLLGREDLDEVNYEHRLFLCAKCGRIASRFDFRIEYGQGQVLQPEFKCNACRGRLVLLTEPLEKVPCSNCGNSTLEQDLAMFWD